MIPKSIFIAYVAIISIFSMSEASKSTIGFTIDLIHRDSPQSPTYDPSLSPSERLSKSIQRSYNRLHRLNTNQKTSPVAKISEYGGEFLMSYSIGTPSVPSLGIVDTGSGTTWTQCPPCNTCIKQKLPLFDPKKSQTYKTIPCRARKDCSTISPDAICDKSIKKCRYSIFYGDGSSTVGDLARDTLTLGSTTNETVSFPNFAFGCGFNNSGTFSGNESGVVGIGGGQASLISQLGSSVQGKFAYCLLPLDSNSTISSKLYFGDSAVVSGQGAVSTPLAPNKDPDFYYLTLEALSVDNQRLEFSDLSKNSSASTEEGNILIDSGTIFTFIPGDLFNKMVKTLDSKLKRTPNPSESFTICWFANRNDRIPVITMHFKGADVVLNTENAFYRTSSSTVCLSMAGADDFFEAIYGNWAQRDFLIGYDLVNKKVSFQRKDCTKT